MSVNRRALVKRSGQSLDIQYRESLGVRPSILGTPSALARPGIGGNTDGLHYQPAPNVDEVIALDEVGGHNSTVVSAFTPALLPIMPTGPATSLFSRGIALLQASGGTLTISNATLSTALTMTGQTLSSSATAGSDTLPANPAGFLTVQVNGTSVKIPYYNP